MPDLDSSWSPFPQTTSRRDWQVLLWMGIVTLASGSEISISKNPRCWLSGVWFTVAWTRKPKSCTAILTWGRMKQPQWTTTEIEATIYGENA